MPNDGAHRPPIPDLSTLDASPVLVPSANGGSVRRSGSAIQGSSLKNLLTQHRRLILVLRQNVTANTQRNPRRRETSRPRNQQEVTEETEDRVYLRSLRCLLFKTPALLTHAERSGSGTPVRDSCQPATSRQTPGAPRR